MAVTPYMAANLFPGEGRGPGAATGGCFSSGWTPAFAGERGVDGF